VCSHNRKPKNQKAKCASYDWDRGLGTCHNCDTSFQLHTYKRKGESEKVYIKPEQPAVINSVGTKVEEWFKTKESNFYANQTHVKAVDNLRRATGANKQQLTRMFNQLSTY
jgi:hypothetical protein